VYDRWQRSYGKDYSAVIMPRLVASLRKRRLAPSTMVDLACGTGSLALLMARRGWRVWGIDASGGMLAEAWKKSAPTGLPVIFLRQDMRTFHIPEAAGVAVSVFDSLNHLLTPKDLKAAFRRVHAAVAPGGWFMFDVNNERCFRLLWTREQSLTHRDFTLLLENTYDARRHRARSRVRILLPTPGRPVVLSETVHERCFDPPEIQSLLTESGFDVDEQEDFNPTGRARVGKIKSWWVARRR
jgi:SAM-dependent methyltransferase